jgi:hypothetical protein
MHSRILQASIVIALFLLAACSVNVKKDNSGEDKNVDIKTPFGEIHVDQGANAADAGLAVYPGSKLKEKGDENGDKSANVNLSAFGYGLKVVALEYQSDDPPSKLLAFYKNELKKYGSVLECHTSHPGNYGPHHHNGDSEQLKCEGDNSGNNIELKVGTENNQHIVSIQPQGKGTDFALVYVHTRGKDDTI